MTRPRPADHRRALVKLLEQSAHRHHRWDLFGDFVELSAIAVANAVDWAQRERREARYLQVVRKYSKEEAARFPLMLAHLVAALEAEPGDHLGAVFGALELQNEHVGQFFTPYALCQTIAALTLGPRQELEARVAARGYFTLLEPAVGAGALVIAAAEHVRAEGLEPRRVMHVTAIDVDPRAVHMSYLQCALLGIPAVVVLGNAITLEEREHWYTPAHILGGWTHRLRIAAIAEAPSPRERKTA